MRALRPLLTCKAGWGSNWPTYPSLPGIEMRNLFVNCQEFWGTHLASVFDQLRRQCTVHSLPIGFSEKLFQARAPKEGHKSWPQPSYVLLWGQCRRVGLWEGGRIKGRCGCELGVVPSNILGVNNRNCLTYTKKNLTGRQWRNHWAQGPGGGLLGVKYTRGIN
jgi:hypothetical protein